MRSWLSKAELGPGGGEDGGWDMVRIPARMLGSQLGALCRSVVYVKARGVVTAHVRMGHVSLHGPHSQGVRSQPQDDLPLGGRVTVRCRFTACDWS